MFFLRPSFRTLVTLIVCADNKPIATFGLAHTSDEAQRKRIVERCFEKYPALEHDLARLRNDPGLVALLLDTLIDVDLLREARGKDSEEEEAFEDSESDVERISLAGTQAPQAM